jgi:hypothetical protein
MNLVDIVDNSITDKNTLHSYLELYQNLLHTKKETAKNVLEIGIGGYYNPNTSKIVCGGGSIKLWNDYFTNATIYALEINNIDYACNEIRNNEKINLYTSVDGYNEDFFNTNFKEKNLKFDFMLDDGPHTLESMIQFIKLYSQLMTDDGILIIEDVQSLEWTNILKLCVPDNLKEYVEVYDLRHIKNRYDDIVFVINKNKNK